LERDVSDYIPGNLKSELKEGTQFMDSYCDIEPLRLFERQKRGYFGKSDRFTSFARLRQSPALQYPISTTLQLRDIPSARYPFGQHFNCATSHLREFFQLFKSLGELV